MNSLNISLWREKISRRGFNWSSLAILSAVFIISGFFVFTPVLAVHETTVKVDPLYVQGNHPDTYTFDISNSSGDPIYLIKITAPTGFTVTGNVVCPADTSETYDWSSNFTSNYVICQTSGHPSNENLISSSELGTISFSATSPNPEIDTEYPWTVYTEDNAWETLTNADARTLVDVTDPVTTDSGTSADWLSVSSVEVTLTSVDEGAGVAETLYCIDTNDTCEPNIVGTSVIISDEGEYHVRFKCFRHTHLSV